MTTIRRLNTAGIETWRAWIADGCTDPAPTSMLTDPAFSEPLDVACPIEPQPFATRFEFGRSLCSLLSALPVSAIRFDAGLWDWLSLYYVDQLAPHLANGRRKQQESVRLSLQLSGRKWSRHFVRMSWMSVQEHGENARMMLNVAMDVHPDLLEQLAGGQETFGSQTVIAVAARLYWDEAAGRTRRGAQAKGKGTPRRLRKLMRQLRRTWDPSAMTCDQLIGLLPNGEFGRWSA